MNTNDCTHPKLCKEGGIRVCDDCGTVFVIVTYAPPSDFGKAINEGLDKQYGVGKEDDEPRCGECRRGFNCTLSICTCNCHKKNCEGNGCPRAAKLETRLAEHFYTKHEIDGIMKDLFAFLSIPNCGIVPGEHIDRRSFLDSFESLRSRFR